MRLQDLLSLLNEGELQDALTALEEHPALARERWQAGPSWPEGCTALHLAAGRGQLEVLRSLARCGADLDAKAGPPGHGRTALQDSYEYGQEAASRLLIELGAYYDICTAAARGDLARVDQLLAEDPLLVHDDRCGLPPLGWAGFGQQPAMVKHLVRAGAQLGSEHFCPCQTGNASILREFLALGADPNQLEPNLGLRPLHVAAEMRYSCDTSEAVELLIQHGADPNGLAADGTTRPLDVARRTAEQASEDARRRTGALRVIERLQAAGARP